MHPHLSDSDKCEFARRMILVQAALAYNNGIDSGCHPHYQILGILNGEDPDPVHQTTLETCNERIPELSQLSRNAPMMT